MFTDTDEELARATMTIQELKTKLGAADSRIVELEAQVDAANATISEYIDLDKKARAETLERCAVLCERLARADIAEGTVTGGHRCARAIRALGDE